MIELNVQHYTLPFYREKTHKLYFYWIKYKLEKGED